jgi:hypothetical protein
MHFRPGSYSGFLSPLVVLLATACPAPADDERPSSTVASDPVFRALLTDGSTKSGRIRQLGPEGKVALEAEGSESAVPLARVVKLTRDNDPPQSPPEGALVVFPEGDRLRATIVVAGETTLQVVPPALGEDKLAIPLDVLLGIVLAPPTEVEATEALLARVRGEARTGDVLWLANRDRLAGSFLELTPQKVKFQPEAGPTLVDRSGVVAIGFDPKQANYPRPKEDYLELTFLDGSRLGVTGCRVEQGHVLAATRFGAPIRLPIAELARVHVRGEAISYLSEREPAGVQYQAYVADPRPYRRDESVEGRTLRLAGQPYDRGLGTQSRTLLAYRLDPRDRRFQALVGLDDRAGPLGSVVFRVRVDGKDVFETPPMTARDVPKLIDVDVSGGKLLILMTEYGDRGEVRDFADWAEARLIR